VCVEIMETNMDSISDEPHNPEVLGSFTARWRGWLISLKLMKKRRVRPPKRNGDNRA